MLAFFLPQCSTLSLLSPQAPLLFTPSLLLLSHPLAARSMTALTATAFSLAAVAVLVAEAWLIGISTLTGAVDGAGRLCADGALGCSLISMILAIVAKFKTRGFAKTAPPALSETLENLLGAPTKSCCCC